MKPIVVILFILPCALSWGGYSINFEHSDLEFDEKIVKLELSMKRQEDKTVVNLRGEILEDVPDHIIFKVGQYEKVNGKFQHFVNSSISACNVLGRFKSHPIMKIVIKELLKSSSIPTSCPIKKGIYYMKDFTVNDDLLPPFIPTGTFMSKIEIARLVDGVEQMALRVTIITDIDYAKERKGLKLF